MKHGIDALLAAVLATQEEPLDDDALEAVEDRFNIYASGQPWKQDDVRLIWRSPAARRAYQRARAANARAATSGWRGRGHAIDLVQRAADGGDEDRVIEAAGLVLSIRRITGREDWLITLELDHDALSEMTGDVQIRLVDDGGRVWIEGAPDSAGGLDGYWGDASQTPSARLRDHKLTLEFI